MEKYLWSLIKTPKMKDFSSKFMPAPLQAVTYTVKVSSPKKWCKIDTLYTPPVGSITWRDARSLCDS